MTWGSNYLREDPARAERLLAYDGARCRGDECVLFLNIGEA